MNHNAPVLVSCLRRLPANNYSQSLSAAFISGRMLTLAPSLFGSSFQIGSMAGYPRDCAAPLSAHHLPPGAMMVATSADPCLTHDKVPSSMVSGQSLPSSLAWMKRDEAIAGMTINSSSTASINRTAVPPVVVVTNVDTRRQQVHAFFAALNPAAGIGLPSTGAQAPIRRCRRFFHTRRSTAGLACATRFMAAWRGGAARLADPVPVDQLRATSATSDWSRGRRTPTCTGVHCHAQVCPGRPPRGAFC